MVSIFDRYPTLKKALVNLKSGKAFRGILYQRRRGYLIVKNVEMIKPGGEVLQMDGDLLIPSENVDFLQLL